MSVLNGKKYQTSFRGEFSCGMESVYNKGQFLLLLTAGQGASGCGPVFERGDSCHY